MIGVLANSALWAVLGLGLLGLLGWWHEGAAERQAEDAVWRAMIARHEADDAVFWAEMRRFQAERREMAGLGGYGRHAAGE